MPSTSGEVRSRAWTWFHALHTRALGRRFWISSAVEEFLSSLSRSLFRYGKETSTTTVPSRSPTCFRVSSMASHGTARITAPAPATASA